MSFQKITEETSLYNDLENKSVTEILNDINTEDQKVAIAVQKTIPQVAKLVEQIVPRMKRGGRIFYMGAGTSGRLGVLDASELPPTFGVPKTLVIGPVSYTHLDVYKRQDTDKSARCRRSAWLWHL